VYTKNALTKILDNTNKKTAGNFELVILRSIVSLKNKIEKQLLTLQILLNKIEALLLKSNKLMYTCEQSLKRMNLNHVPLKKKTLDNKLILTNIDGSLILRQNTTPIKYRKINPINYLILILSGLASIYYGLKLLSISSSINAFCLNIIVPTILFILAYFLSYKIGKKIYLSNIINEKIFFKILPVYMFTLVLTFLGILIYYNQA